MKVLVAHNFYQQPGGEDQVFAAEAHLLEEFGHKVIRYTETNDRVSEYNRARLAVATIWNRDSYRRLFDLVRAEKPEIVHFHNTFPLISPSAYYAARRAGAAVVQTLHNYRFICPGANLLRDGTPCEDCVSLFVPWKGVRHRCYRGNRLATAGVAGMLAAHRATGTWKRAIDAYIVLTEFARARFVQGGLPAERLFRKPNFLGSDPGAGSGGRYFLFAGRLGSEKGLDVLLDAWKSRPDLPELRILGEGGLGEWLKSAIVGLPNVKWMGRQTHAVVIEHMKNACALVLPSVCYEGFPLTLVEAYACGTPVIGSDAGTLPELIRNGDTGYVFRSGNPASLAQAVSEMTQNPSSWNRLKTLSRNEFEAYYQGNRNYQLLMNIYERAIKNRREEDKGR